SYVQLSEENRVLMGKAGDGSVTAYIDGQGVAEHLGEVKAGAGKAYITDHLGSVLNSPLTGSGKAYGLYGEANSKLGVSQTSIPVAYGFAGYKFDSESGNYSTPNRIYNPSVGRWLSQDPIGFNSKDSNYYRYVKNSPLLYSDPSGKNRRAAIVGCTLMMGGMTSLGLSKYQRSQNTENWMWYGGAGAVLVGAGIILGDQYLNNDAAQYGPLTPAEQSDQNTLDNLQQQLDNMTGQDGGGDGA
ncbi:MAG: RHS repeat-associated core domain-containing protein, partial [Bdellovibrionota bacterium]